MGATVALLVATVGLSVSAMPTSLAQTPEEAGSSWVESSLLPSLTEIIEMRGATEAAEGPADIMGSSVVSQSRVSQGEESQSGDSQSGDSQSGDSQSGDLQSEGDQSNEDQSDEPQNGAVGGEGDLPQSADGGVSPQEGADNQALGRLPSTLAATRTTVKAVWKYTAVRESSNSVLWLGTPYISPIGGVANELFYSKQDQYPKPVETIANENAYSISIPATNTWGQVYFTTGPWAGKCLSMPQKPGPLTGIKGTQLVAETCSTGKASQQFMVNDYGYLWAEYGSDLSDRIVVHLSNAQPSNYVDGTGIRSNNVYMYTLAVSSMNAGAIYPETLIGGPGTAIDPEQPATPGYVLGLEGSRSPATVKMSGTTVSYTFTVKNQTPMGWQAALFDPKLKMTSFDGSGNTGSIVCKFPTSVLLPQGYEGGAVAGTYATCKGTYTVAADDLAKSAINLTVQAEATDNSDDNWGNLVFSKKLTLTFAIAADKADLELTLDGPEEVRAGESISWEASVKNLGPSSAPGYTLQDSVPAGVTVTSVPSGCQVSGNDIVCVVNTALASGATSPKWVFTGTVDSDAAAPACNSELGNDATVIIKGISDPNLANNYAQVRTKVLCSEEAAVSWSKVDGGGSALAGSVWRITNTAGTYDAEVEDCTAGPGNAGECTGPDQDPRPGYFTVPGLPADSYTLTEVKAPAGYVLDPAYESIAFDLDGVDTSVGPGGQDDSAAFVNVKQAVAALPLTGALAQGTVLALGVLLVSGLLALTLWFHRTQRKVGSGSLE